MNILIENEISRLETETQKVGMSIKERKIIPYGVQLIFYRGEDCELPVNIYFSQKKGLSYVLGGNKNNVLRAILNRIIGQEETNAQEPLLPDWNIWAGTDESGKGDFFGPLVVAGVAVKKEQTAILKELGVKDCKLLTNEQITLLAPKIMNSLRNQYEIIALKPKKYNELYKDFSEQGKKLNELLAWMHGRVILNLAAKTSFEGVIVDKFAAEKVLMSSLKEISNFRIIQRAKAESDLAVAAASVLARNYFLKSIKQQNYTHRFIFPLGAGANVVKAANNFALKYGYHALENVAKTHFKTIEQVQC